MEPFACRLVGQYRSTQRHGGKVVDFKEAKLCLHLRDFLAEDIRWDHRKNSRMLWLEGVLRLQNVSISEVFSLEELWLLQ